MATIDEAAIQLGVSRETVRRRIRDGTLSATLVNGKYRVDLPAEPTAPVQDGQTAANDRVAELLEAQLVELHQDKEELRHQLEIKDRQIFELHQMMGVKALESGNAGRKWRWPWSR